MLSKLILLISVLVISGCVVDRRSEVVVINNNSRSSVLVVKTPIPDLTDSLVFIDHLDQTDFSSGEIRGIAVPYGNLKNLPASEKMYVYIFSIDSLEKYRRLKKMQGIMKSSLIREFSLQLNQVQDPVRTEYVINTF